MAHATSKGSRAYLIFEHSGVLARLQHHGGSALHCLSRQLQRYITWEPSSNATVGERLDHEEAIGRARASEASNLRQTRRAMAKPIRGEHTERNAFARPSQHKGCPLTIRAAERARKRVIWLRRRVGNVDAMRRQ